MRFFSNIVFLSATLAAVTLAIPISDECDEDAPARMLKGRALFPRGGGCPGGAGGTGGPGPATQGGKGSTGNEGNTETPQAPNTQGQNTGHTSNTAPALGADIAGNLALQRLAELGLLQRLDGPIDFQNDHIHPPPN